MRPLTSIDLKRLIERLQPWEGRSLLEPFAGSASLSRTALTYGASKALLFEKDTHQAARLKRAWAGDSRVRIWRMDFRAGLRRLAGHEQFDFCFLDPPFGSGFFQTAVVLLERYRLLKNGGILAIKTPPHEWLELQPPWQQIFTLIKSDISLGAWRYEPKDL